MNAVVFDVALTAYIVAAVAAVGGLFGRRHELQWFASAMALAGWICHTMAIVLRGAELGRIPVASLAEALSMVIWIAVGAELWIERRYRTAPLRAFVLPVVLALGLGLPTGLRGLALAPASSAFVLVHVGLVLVGLAALVLNVGGAIMYILQERQLKSRRPGEFLHVFPSLDVLDRLTFGTLAAGFPFLTVGLMLGVMSAAQPGAQRSLADPLSVGSLLMWAVYAVTLAGRAVGHWRGRRAAYFAIAGFGVLLLALGVGVWFEARHGS